MFNILDINFTYVYNNGMEDKLKIGEILKIKRLQLNLRMEDVAQKVGITRSTLWSIENGSGNYSIDTLLKLLKTLNLSLDIDSQEQGNRVRATRANTARDKKINRFVVTCVEQYAQYKNINSKSAYVLLNTAGLIKELADDYEDLHGTSTYSLNKYIESRLED